MSVRFKFRSAVSFDSVDIEGRPSISVRDLRSKIVRHKNLDICHDFDLVFSDAVTGQGQLSLSVPYVPVICSLFFYFSEENRKKNKKRHEFGLGWLATSSLSFD
ncbi:hypothetical protein CK203_003627 [Vitis vinifera]|uniref:DWNN domain-containing protein n=1 Tax=Vitis vinifera TaxID=29760 RepID=A0A438EWW3_VITVI|nr:hypothetical protein CK203_077297 [Vitis vinifera]RVX17358.1 hypothetical protein CK203_003627 [Vitis vinifera]